MNSLAYWEERKGSGFVQPATALEQREPEPCTRSHDVSGWNRKRRNSRLRKSRFRDEVIQNILDEYWAVTLLIGREKPTRAFFRSLIEEWDDLEGIVCRGDRAFESHLLRQYKRSSPEALWGRG